MRRTRLTVFVHLVWATWDRLPLLTDDLTREVYRAIGAKCTELRAEVIAIGGVADHVHLLVELPATLTIAHLVGQVKGVSAHLINHRLTPGASFKWRGAYAAFSVSPRAVPRVVDYIARQQEHHAAGTAIPELELSATERGTPTNEEAPAVAHRA